MRTSLIMAGTLAALLASSAYAQQTPAPQPQPPGGPNGHPPGILVIGPAPQGNAAGPGGGPAADQGAQQQMMAQGEHGGPFGGPPHPAMMMGHHRPGFEMDEAMMHMMPPKGAVFMFRDGDERMLIKCADSEPTKVCVDAATTLIDKINAGQGGEDQQSQSPQGQQGSQGNQNQ